MNTKQQNSSNNEKNNDWSKREIGALWKKEGPTQKYLSGYLTVDEFGAKTKLNVVVFSNKNKSKDTAPDFRVYIQKDRNTETVSTENKQVKPQAVSPKKTVKVVEESETEEDLL